VFENQSEVASLSGGGKIYLSLGETDQNCHVRKERKRTFNAVEKDFKVKDRRQKFRR